jgi:WD40 repeat protein
MDRVNSAELLRQQRIGDDELRQMFLQIDLDQSGFIDETELQNALKLYGIQFSISSSQKLLQKIDKSGRGEIRFDAFKEFFGRVENPNDLKMLLSAESRKFFDYKQMVDGDPAFAKTYAIPPLVSPLEKIIGHIDAVEKVVWVSDTEVVSGSTDGEVRKSTVGQQNGVSLFNIGSSLYSMSLSPDGKRLLVGHGTKDSNCTMWSLEEGGGQSALTVYSGNDAPVYATAYAPDYLATGTKSGGCCVYSPSSPAPIITWEGHQGVVYSADFAKSGVNRGALVTASKDGTVKVWDARGSPTTMKPVAEIPEAAAGGAAWQALWRRDFELLTCGDDYSIKRWDSRKLADGPLSCYFGHSDIVRCIALSPCQTYLASGTVGGSVRLWMSGQDQLLADRLANVQLEGAEARKRVAKLTELFENGELDDANELKVAQSRKNDLEAQAAELEEQLLKQKMLGCVQAARGLDGSALPVSSLAWRNCASGVLRVAVGSHDQAVRVFEVTSEDLAPL